MADDKSPHLTILYNTRGQKLEDLLAFPIHVSMGQGYDSPEVAREKQRRLTGEMAEAPETIAQYEGDPEDEGISDAEPPKVVPKFLTGRIPEHWKPKSNGK